MVPVLAMRASQIESLIGLRSPTRQCQKHGQGQKADALLRCAALGVWLRHCGDCHCCRQLIAGKINRQFPTQFIFLLLHAELTASRMRSTNL